MDALSGAALRKAASRHDDDALARLARQHPFSEVAQAVENVPGVRVLPGQLIAGRVRVIDCYGQAVVKKQWSW